MKKNELIQAELDASTFEIAKSENVEVQQSATSDSAACNNIDWEQRRWQLAHGIFLHYSDLTNKACIEMADAFIKEYKKSLKRVVSGSIAV